MMIRSQLKRPIVIAILGSAWQVVSGVANITVFLRFAGIETIGLYYTMNSMLAMSSIFEFGAPQAIIQWVAFHFGRQQVDGAQMSSRSDIGMLLCKLVVYYSALSACFVVLTTCIITEVVGRRQGIILEWLPVAVIYCMSLANQAVWQIIEGSGQVQNAYMNRLLRAVAASLALWAGLAGGLGIGALALSWAANAFIGWWQLLYRYGPTLKHWMQRSSGRRFEWRREILPLQWRMGLVWSSGFFLHPIINPIVYNTFGAETAGRLGLCLSITNALVAFASLPVQTSTYRLAVFAAARYFAEFHKRLVLASGASVGLYVCGATAVFLMVDFLQLHGISRFERLGNLELFGIVLAFSLAYVLALPFLAYFRAFKREPLWFVSVMTNLMSGFFVWLASRYFSVEDVMVVYGLVIASSTLTIALIFFFGHLREKMTETFDFADAERKLR